MTPIPTRLVIVPLLLLAATASVASAVGVCIGTGELCVEGTAATPGTTNGDTAEASYGVSSTTLSVDEEDSHSCGLLVQQAPWTRAGAGCASEATAVWLHRSDVNTVSPGVCVGVQASGASLPCVAPGTFGSCAGLQWANEGSPWPTDSSAACATSDYVGACFVESRVASFNACGGADAYGAPCPNGDEGTQVSLIADGSEVKLVCFAADEAPDNVPGGAFQHFLP